MSPISVHRLVTMTQVTVGRPTGFRKFEGVVLDLASPARLVILGLRLHEATSNLTRLEDWPKGPKSVQGISTSWVGCDQRVECCCHSGVNPEGVDQLAIPVVFAAARCPAVEADPRVDKGLECVPGRTGSVGPSSDQPAPVGRQVPEAVWTKFGDGPGHWLGRTRASTWSVFRREHPHTLAHCERRLNTGMRDTPTIGTATRQRQRPLTGGGPWSLGGDARRHAPTPAEPCSRPR
jgi:hypothetical protein